MFREEKTSGREITLGNEERKFPSSVSLSIQSNLSLFLLHILLNISVVLVYPEMHIIIYFTAAIQRGDDSQKRKLHRVNNSLGIFIGIYIEMHVLRFIAFSVPEYSS